MSDLPSALGIEAVELVAEGGRSVTVRVTGRWRRRRPELRGQAMLVVETGTVRQRFVAMPEPPSLTGAAPGTWRMAFAVPAELAPQLPGKTFLQLGAVMVPLPVGEMVEAAGGGGGEDPGPELLEARQLRSSELAAESARRRAAEAEAAVAGLVARIGEMEDELGRARDESDRLREVIRERERELRGSQQNIHSERARRSEVENALTEKTRTATRDLRALHEHVADLERELARMRRSVDEAEHLAAAAMAGRLAAERRLAERPPPVAEAVEPAPAVAVQPEPEPAARVDNGRGRLLAAEFELAGAAPARPHAARPSGPAPRSPRPADQSALALESAMAERRGAREDGERRAQALERELAGARDDVADARGEVARARGELAQARRELERQRLLNERAYAAIDQVRAELARLGAGSPGEETPRAPAPSGAVQADKLSAALTRLRETRPTTPPIPEPTTSAPAPSASAPPTAEPARSRRPAKPWLGKAFRTLAVRDGPAAGRLLLALLPAQRAADPQPVAYDLVLGDLACARVTVGSAAVHVEVGDEPRPMSEVDFQLVGDLASIARLLTAGPVHRWLTWLPGRYRVARIRGDRSRLPALEHLLKAPLSLSQLRAAGVRFDPLLALTVAAAMIEPEWTAGERFTIGHREAAVPAPDAYLHVLGGRPPLAAAEPPHGPVATVIACAGEELLGVLAGEPGARFALEGEDRPLALVRQWIDRAQCG
ncbi:MAG TPA: hypothetical protein VMS02_00070 [Solirubrobacteraceae bacterium]|nr:hypothetical protein [Solirubrobacteraceae bacterium]